MSNDDVRRLSPKLSPKHDHEEWALLDQAGQTLFRLGRIISRRPLRDEAMGRSPQQAVELSRILVAEAIAAGPVETDYGVTVGAVAERLAIDPSTASRLVADAVGAGYVTRLPSRDDNRRVGLELTDAGRTLVADAHRYQRDVFAQLTGDWPEDERQEFARLLVKFVAAVMEASPRSTVGRAPTGE